MSTHPARPGVARSVSQLIEAAPPIALPVTGGQLSQDSEWFLVKHAGTWQQLRMHDYPDIYSIPGLYEKVVYDVLECASPGVIRDELVAAIEAAGEDASSMTVLDLGAGNGVVAEFLADAGVGAGEDGSFVGADLLPEAAEAADRDRPGLYDEYIVGDITDLPPRQQRKLEATEPDAMTCVAALGFGDIPPEAFVAAMDRVRPGGWIAFCIKDQFVSDRDRSGFSLLIEGLIERGILEVASSRTYTHRKALTGEPLEYVAYIARKRGEAPADLVERCRS